jgi:hypothetical protein
MFPDYCPDVTGLLSRCHRNWCPDRAGIRTDYNAKQKRADRKIENYYNHLFGNAGKKTVATSANREKSFYEIAVGVGVKTLIRSVPPRA